MPPVPSRVQYACWPMLRQETWSFTTRRSGPESCFHENINSHQFGFFLGLICLFFGLKMDFSFHSGCLRPSGGSRDSSLLSDVRFSNISWSSLGLSGDFRPPFGSDQSLRSARITDFSEPIIVNILLVFNGPEMNPPVYADLGVLSSQSFWAWLVHSVRRRSPES